MSPNTPQTTKRRQAREAAFNFLFSKLKTESYSESVEFSKPEFEKFCENFEYGFDPYSWTVTEGTGKKLPLIDQNIVQLSAHWKIERMSLVDLSLLRLGAFEILFCEEIPKTVAINEAVEIAKKYGSEDSAAFVNGILDKFEKNSIK